MFFSEVLKAVKLEGAIYYNAEFTAPWSIRTPPSRVRVGWPARAILKLEKRSRFCTAIPLKPGSSPI